MKKTKRKAVINLIIFFLLLAGGIYMAIAGVVRSLHFRADAGSQLCRFPCRHRAPPQLQGAQPERCAEAPHPVG